VAHVLTDSLTHYLSVCLSVCLSVFFFFRAVAKKSKAAEVGALSRVNFVSLLKKEAGQKDRKAAAASSSSAAALQLLQSGKVDKDGDLSVSVNFQSEQRGSSGDAPPAATAGSNVSGDSDSDSGDSRSEEEGGGGQKKKAGWNALQDSFLVDRKLALKVC
jgi:hypothetical protein